ncbi:YceI family protein [Burkholderiaceae bacterium DAT-1]|nr:YceI family protein [Burkholderiaceae bacterium DAT-1]
MKARSLIAALITGASLAAFAAPEKFEFDATHTYPHFEINHLGFSVMRGMFTDTTGTLTLDRAAKTGQVEATISTKSINTGMDKRDEHLRSKDFFNVEQFPTMTFKSEKFAFKKGEPVAAEGTLTLLGETKPVKLMIKPSKCAVRMVDQKFVCGADVSTTIKRSDWGLKAYVPYVGDDVKISIEVEAVKL